MFLAAKDLNLKINDWKALIKKSEIKSLMLQLTSEKKSLQIEKLIIIKVMLILCCVVF